MPDITPPHSGEVNEIYSFTFKLRKPFPELKPLLGVANVLLTEHNYHALFQLDGSTSRWFIIKVYEKHEAHPSLCVTRMLESSNIKAQKAVSILNIATSMNCPLRLEASEDMTSITVTVSKPESEKNLATVMKHISLVVV